MTYHARTLAHSAAARGVCAGLAAATLLWAPMATAETGGQNVADLVENVIPAVVTVLTTQEARGSTVFGGQASPFPPGSPLERFFRHFGTPPGMQGPNRGAPMHALGSGFVIDEDGYIVTNNHVVENAAKVQVRLTDEREFDAEVVGVDEQTDLALLKISAKDLPYLKLGDSDAMRVGDDVVAVGNPFGLGGTVTRGIISAKGRDIKAGPYVDFIQTDAAINHGNSGGPLFNLDGDVIGVNAAIYSPSGGSVGVGFAIPSNTVKYVVAQLKADGEVARGWLGVTIQNVTPEIARALDMDKPHGALVADVAAGSPADGVLEPGDVIIGFGGDDVADSHALPGLVAATKAGSETKVVVMRNGREKTLNVTVGALAGERRAANDAGGAAPADGSGAVDSDRLGAALVALTPEARQRLGVRSAERGAVIAALEEGGPAAEAGLRVGDVIERVGDAEISTPADVVAALDKIDAGVALVLVRRGDGRVFVGVDVAA
ncbi:Do family serine endopeptidase [Pikeienuella sp. HZG-20]|uniref:Do family serine endopeptidase n=1 Tax=Paludibacillus litoralis TaxID=3133267 RepID=UPI0030EE7C26